MSTDKEVTKEWRAREKKRLDDGTYTSVPWENEDWYLNSPHVEMHFPHTSSNDKNLIAYTPDDDKGERDVRNSAKPRKYLTKHFGNVLSDKGIHNWAEKFMLKNNPVNVEIAMTRQDIRWVYEHGQVGCNPADDDGTGSCMTYEIGHFYSRPIHPVEAYAYGDLGIAFMVYRGDSHQVCARALVWPNKKQYGRIFGRNGKENELRVWLDSQGYDSGNMVGAKLLKLLATTSQYRDKIICPYLDCYQQITIHDNYLEIEREGRATADSQYGILRYNCRDNRDGEEFNCTSCQEWHYVDELHGRFGNGEGVCECCYDQYYFTCEDCNEMGYNDNMCCIDDGEKYICESCYSDEYFHCDTCDIAQHIDREMGLLNGCSICEGCVESEGYHVKDCGTVVPINTYEIEVAQCGCCEPEEVSRTEV